MNPLRVGLAAVTRKLVFPFLSLSFLSLQRLILLGVAGGTIAVLAIETLAQEPTTPTASSSPAPVAYASVNELNGILDQVKMTAASMQTDLGNVRIEKWKTDPANKRQAQGNLDSIQRNLQAALPEIISQVSASPEDLTSSFKLYRNLDALYDVFGSVVESAGAFGSRDEFQSLSKDMEGLESARHAMGERMQKLTAAKEGELTRLRAQVKQLSAVPPPPKKVIVDDTEPEQKPAPKKKTSKPMPTKKPTAPTSQSPPKQSPPATTNPPQ